MKNPRHLYYIVSIIIILAALLALGACSSSSTTTSSTSVTTTSAVTTTAASSTTAATSTSPATSTATATPSAATSTAVPAGFTINTMDSATLGTYLVTGTGMTLYYYASDTAGVSNVPANIIGNWPPFNADTINVPSTLNAADFSMMARSDGSMQTTYKGWPLYTFVQDKAPGDTKGQGLLNLWFVVVPSQITPAPTAAAPTTSTSTTTTTSTTTSSGSNAVTINLTAQGFAFNMSTITVPAGATVTINFDNKDSGVPHNFALYTDSSAATSIFVGQIITGTATTTYTFTAPSTPGSYFFRCDVHPTQMTGTFVVQ